MKAKKSLGLKIKNNFARAKKALGQNFLKSELALRKIVETGEIKKDDVILEIGPGKGALTSKLLAFSCQVIAIEKDRELITLLKEKFKKEIEEKRLNLIHGDILDFDITQIVRQDLTIYKIIANIPYNITGAILKKFLTEKDQPESMILMVQHEVAKRIMAQDKKESMLSLSVKAYGEPKMIMKVPARYFSPAPKVDSAIIAIRNISRELFITLEFEKKFWEIVRAGFAHKRKKLSSNLKNTISCQGESLTFLGNKRAENLTLEDWILLTKECYN